MPYYGTNTHLGTATAQLRECLDRGCPYLSVNVTASQVAVLRLTEGAALGMRQTCLGADKSGTVPTTQRLSSDVADADWDIQTDAVQSPTVRQGVCRFRSNNTQPGSTRNGDARIIRRAAPHTVSEYGRLGYPNRHGNFDGAPLFHGLMCRCMCNCSVHNAMPGRFPAHSHRDSQRVLRAFPMAVYTAAPTVAHVHAPPHHMWGK